MIHPVLGEVVKSPDLDDFYTAKVELDGSPIDLDLNLDDATLEDALVLAVEIATSISSLVSTARKIASRDLLEIYNDGWNTYDEVQGDGTIETVTNPQLSAEAFEAKLLPDGVRVLGDSCVDVWFKDNGLFWGHTIQVTSFEGVDFSDAEAELLG